MMGMTQKQLSTALAEQTGITWSRECIANIESGNRNMTDELYGAIQQLITSRKDAPCRTPGPTTPRRSASNVLSQKETGPTPPSPRLSAPLPYQW